MRSPIPRHFPLALLLLAGLGCTRPPPATTPDASAERAWQTKRAIRLRARDREAGCYHLDVYTPIDSTTPSAQWVRVRGHVLAVPRTIMLDTSESKTWVLGHSAMSPQPPAGTAFVSASWYPDSSAITIEWTHTVGTMGGTLRVTLHPVGSVWLGGGDFSHDVEDKDAASSPPPPPQLGLKATPIPCSV